MRIVVQIHTTYLYHTVYTDSPENAYPGVVVCTDAPSSDDPVWSTGPVLGYAHRVLFASSGDGFSAVYFYTNKTSFPSPLQG